MPMLRLLAVAAVALSLNCGNSTSYGGPNPPPPPPPPPAPGGHSTTITVADNFFDPTPDTVPAGTVTFSWSVPSNGHNVTWISGPGTLPANSDTKGSGTFAPTLQVGTYAYHCTVHSGMNGTIVVR